MGSPVDAPGLESLLYAKKGGIACATRNCPKVLNPLNQRTGEDLRRAFEDARDEAAVRGVTGFSAFA